MPKSFSYKFIIIMMLFYWPQVYEDKNAIIPYFEEGKAVQQNLYIDRSVQTLTSWLNSNLSNIPPTFDPMFFIK